MFKISALVWIVLGTVLAGIAVLIVVATPAFAPDAASLIPIVSGVAFLAAIPVSYLVARRIGDARVT